MMLKWKSKYLCICGFITFRRDPNKAESSNCMKKKQRQIFIFGGEGALWHFQTWKKCWQFLTSSNSTAQGSLPFIETILIISSFFCSRSSIINSHFFPGLFESPPASKENTSKLNFSSFKSIISWSATLQREDRQTETIWKSNWNLYNYI